MAGKLFIISGCSGVGKGTLIKKLLEEDKNIKLSVSATTRKAREGEIDGVHYHFLNKNDFLASVKNGDFLEWAEFSGNMYGTSKVFVENELNKGSDVLLEIEVQGASQVRAKMKEAVSIFILPPSIEELEKRLRGRNTETEEAIQKRLQQVQREYLEAEKFDYRVINDDLDKALNEIRKIIDKTRSL